MADGPEPLALRGALAVRLRRRSLPPARPGVGRNMLRRLPGVAVGRADLRLGHPPLHTGATRCGCQGAVRWLRRDRPLARLSRHRRRRAQPVGLLPRGRRPGRPGRCTSRRRHQGLRRLQPLGRRHPPSRHGRRRALPARCRPRRRRRLPRHPQGGRRSAPRRAGGGPRRGGGRGRVDAAASAPRRPPALVGPVVRRLTRARRRPLAPLRAAAHDAPRPALAPRPHRGAAVGLAQRGRRHGVGGRLRGLGGLDRPRRRAAAAHGPGPARAGTPARRGRVDSTRRPRRGRMPCGRLRLGVPVRRRAADRPRQPERGGRDGAAPCGGRRTGIRRLARDEGSARRRSGRGRRPRAGGRRALVAGPGCGRVVAPGRPADPRLGGVPAPAGIADHSSSGAGVAPSARLRRRPGRRPRPHRAPPVPGDGHV
jgi:hypothetical protein